MSIACIVSEKALAQEPLHLTDCLPLLTLSTEELTEFSHELTLKFAEQYFNCCAIVNAKSGRCSEDCHWCAQSRHFTTGAATFPLLNPEAILKSALAAQDNGVTRFGIVTSGRKLSRREVREAAQSVRLVREKTDLEVCLSMGLLTKDEFTLLKDAGAARCHCNLEASESFFSKVCTSHTTQDKIRCIQAAREAGLDVCSGGIIGMGETEENRLDLAITLANLHVASIPINILSPIPGTPLESTPLISDKAIIRTVALFRITNPRAYLRFAGGRARLSESTLKACLQAGINSAIMGDMLTTSGTAVAKDRRMAQEVGYSID